MNYKRILSGVIALSMITNFSYLTSAVNRASVQSEIMVSAAETLEYGVLTYEVRNNGVIITGCSEDAEAVDIPEKIDGVSVVEIGYKAFYGCNSIIKIKIPESVTSIGDYAFFGCKRIAGITIPESVTSIGNCAFYGCSSLTEITIPESVTSIGDYAFASCSSLTEITIPESVTDIGSGVFAYGIGITKITIPESVTNIGNNTFSGCSGITKITIPKSVTSIGDYAFVGCSSLTEITISESVTSIGGYAFSGTPWIENMKKVNPMVIINGILIDGDSCEGEIDIPESVTSIGGSAFIFCADITKIIIPESVASIGNSAFYNCTSLTEVTILNKNIKIDETVFENSALETIYGYSGSTAQKYAELNGYNFIAIDESGQMGEVTTTEPPVPIKVPENDEEKQELIKELPDIASCVAFRNDFDLLGLKITVDYYEYGVLKSGLDVSEFIKVADGVTPESLYDKKHFVYDVPLAFDRSMIAEDGTVVIDGKRFYVLDIADAFDGVTIKICIGARGDITLDHTVDARDIALISEEYNEMMMNDDSILLDELKKREFPSDLAESFSDNEIADFASRLGNAKNKLGTALNAVDMAYISYFYNEMMLADDGEFDEYEYWRDFDAEK